MKKYLLIVNNTLLMCAMLALGGFASVTEASLLAPFKATAEEGTFGFTHFTEVKVTDIATNVAQVKITLTCNAANIDVSTKGGAVCNESTIWNRDVFGANGNSITYPIQLINLSSKPERTGITIQAFNANNVSLKKQSFIIDQYGYTPMTMKTPVMNEVTGKQVTVSWDLLPGTLLDYYKITVSKDEKVIFTVPQISKLKKDYTITEAQFKTMGLTKSTENLSIILSAIKKNGGREIGVGGTEHFITYPTGLTDTSTLPQVYRFTTSIVGSGSIVGKPQDYVKEGTVVTMTATPSTGYTFSGWSGACTGTGSCVVTVNQNTQVTATFVPALTDSYQESNGLLIIEAEKTTSNLVEDADTRWEIIRPGDSRYFQGEVGPTGSAYIKFVDSIVPPDYSSPVAPLEYKFTINNPGYYQLHLRAHKTLETIRTDLNNDAYIRVEGEIAGGGVRTIDAPFASLSEDTKISGGGGSAWAWADQVHPFGGSKKTPIYKFDKGTYTLVISGRSRGFDIDRIVFRDLAKIEGAQAKDYRLPESSMVDGGVPVTVPQVVFGQTGIQTTERVNVRSLPTLTGTRLYQTYFGEKGTIIGGPVTADNIVWWKIEFPESGYTGWSGDDNLQVIPSIEGDVLGQDDSYIASLPNLTIGMTHPGVAAIQQFLNSRGFTVNPVAGEIGSAGKETSYFGIRTQNALSVFQASKGIAPAQGQFDAQTRDAIVAEMK